MATTMIEIPHQCKALAPVVQSCIEQVCLALGELGDGDAVDYALIEERIAQASAQLERAAHQLILGTLDVDSEHVRIGDALYKRVGRYPAIYRTLAGEVTIERSRYRQVGARNAKTVDPVSLRAGVLEDGWLPRTARAMAHLLAQGTSRDAVSISNELVRIPYSRSSFERIGHAVGELYVARQERIDKALARETEIPDNAHSISVSLDRVSLPMEEPLDDEDDTPWPSVPRRDGTWTNPGDTGLQPEAQWYVDEARRSRAERKVARNYRMSFCATITLHDGKGRALHTIRYGRLPTDNLRSLGRTMQHDVNALLARRPELVVVLLADGASEIWSFFSQYLNESTLGIEPICLIDAWHLLEKLAAAATLLEVRGRVKPWTFKEWRRTIYEQEDGVEQVLAALTATGGRTLGSDGKRPVHEVMTYIEKRLPLMKYHEALERGLPIGSGNVEATCKSLVSVRMKRPGARWKPRGAEHILGLRALCLSDRWQPAIARALRPLRMPVRAASALEASDSRPPGPSRMAAVSARVATDSRPSAPSRMAAAT